MELGSVDRAEGPIQGGGWKDQPSDIGLRSRPTGQSDLSWDTSSGSSGIRGPGVGPLGQQEGPDGRSGESSQQNGPTKTGKPEASSTGSGSAVKRERVLARVGKRRNGQAEGLGHVLRISYGGPLQVWTQV